MLTERDIFISLGKNVAKSITALSRLGENPISSAASDVQLIKNFYVKGTFLQLCKAGTWCAPAAVLAGRHGLGCDVCLCTIDFHCEFVKRVENEKKLSCLYAKPLL